MRSVSPRRRPRPASPPISRWSRPLWAPRPCPEGGGGSARDRSARGDAAGGGASFGGEFETGCEYGWEIVSVDGNEDIRLGDAVYLNGMQGGGSLRCDGESGSTFEFGESGDAATQWVLSLAPGNVGWIAHMMRGG